MRQIFFTFLAVATAGLFLAAEGHKLENNTTYGDNESVWQQDENKSDFSIPVPGDDPCTWGPAHWCKNLKASSECATTSWCIDGPWKDMHAESDNGRGCKTCKVAITEGRNKLRNNVTQTDIETFLQHEFNTLVLRNYSNFVEIVSSPIETTVVCTIVGHCGSL